MTLDLARTGTDVWIGRIGHVRLYLDDEEGAANRAQAALAEAVVRSLPALRETAEAYLDLFVDRQRACGDAREAWWLDEIEFGDATGADSGRYTLHFTLHGDDGGQWAVEMRASADAHRPVRFERRQG